MGLIGGELPCAKNAVAVIYDTGTGDLVWYEDIDSDGTLSTGNMVLYTDEQTIVGETGRRVVEVDLLGNRLARFEVDYPGNNLHHDIFKANGAYYGVYIEKVGFLMVDPVVILDPQGEEIFEWNPRDHLPIASREFGDWLHTNSVWVDDDDSVLLSWHTRDSVAKVDLDPNSPTFGEVLWIMDGDPPDELPSDITIDWSGPRRARPSSAASTTSTAATTAATCCSTTRTAAAWCSRSTRRAAPRRRTQRTRPTRPPAARRGPLPTRRPATPSSPVAGPSYASTTVSPTS